MRLLRALHRWIGIALAIPVILVSLSGGLLLFRDAYYRARYPSIAAPLAESPVATYAATFERIQRRFEHPGVRIVKFPREGFNAFHVYLGDRTEALLTPTGDVLARWSWRTSAPAFLFDLHAHLLAGAKGEMVNGYLALLLLFAALTGLILWMPRRASAYRLRRFWPRSTRPADLIRAHAASGVLLLVPIAIFSATGAGLVFYERASRVMSAVLDRSPSQVPDAVVPTAPARHRPWSEILEAVQRTLPEAGPSMYYPGAGVNAVLTFRKSLPGEWHPNGRSYVLVDPYTADVVQAIDARRQGAGTRIMHALYPVHAAKVGGAPLILAAIAAALGLVWLAANASWAFLGKLLAQPVLSKRRADADRQQRPRADCRDGGSSLHAHQPGSVPAAVRARHGRS